MSITHSIGAASATTVALRCCPLPLWPAVAAVLASVSWSFGSVYQRRAPKTDNLVTALASTYAYVNPIVAVVLGMLLFHERFTPLEAVASTVILAGVALMMVPPRRAPA